MNSTAETLEVDRIGSKPVFFFFEKLLHEQSQKSDLFVTTKISESEGSPRAAFLSGTGVDSRTNLKTRSTKTSLLSLEMFLETAKGLQLLQEIDRKSVGSAGDEEEELDSSDSENDQHFRQSARQRRLRKQRRTGLRILLDEITEQGTSKVRTATWSFGQSVERRGTSIGRQRGVFCNGATRWKLPLASESELDAGLAQWMNTMYAEGHRAWQGERVVAGLLFFLPEYGKPGNKSIPRSLRASRVGENCPRRFHGNL